MSIFVIGDLHLSFHENKPMSIFGDNWEGHEEKIKKDWIAKVKEEDLVILPGDFSWSTYLKDTYEDFTYLNSLPGKKILLKGNHDYWWTTLKSMRKYLQENNTEFDDKGSDQFWIEMRYAEVLLNLAEALAEQDYAKNQDDALEALNEVRRRVDLPERTTQEAPDKDSFMKLLRKERICELAFEGFRYWDLRRWRLAGEVIDGKQAHGTKITKKDDNSYTYEQVSCDDNINRFFPERYYLLPIPVDELQNNPLCENNAPW